MRKIAELQDGLSGVGLSGRVLSIERREVTVGEEKKTVFSGTLADQTGKTMFSSWHDFGLKEGDAIRVSGGYTKSWRGILQFNFDDRSQLEKLDDFPAAKDLSKPVTHSIASLDRVASAIDVEVRGIVLDIRPGSGLIFRCPQCNRVLQAQSCREHGDVEGEPDMRVKAILDDSSGAMTVVCGRDVTERLLGKDLEAVLKEIHGKKVVNYDTVRDKVAEMLVAKPVSVRGNATNDEFGLMLVSTELRFLSMGVADDARAILAEEEGAQ
jgi:replication factor A1